MNENIKNIAEIIALSIVGDTADDEDIQSSTPIATALYKAGYRKRSIVVKEFAGELIDKIYNGALSEDSTYRQGQQAMAFWVTKYIADLSEQFEDMEEV